MELDKLKVLELFGGIRACSKALERLGIEYECVDYVEIDKYAVASANAIYGTNYKPQDICNWDKDIDVDLIMHGSPCQDFSLAGKQAGGDEGSGTRSSLMYETLRIVEKLKPKYVVWENVKNVLSEKHKHNFDAYLERMEQLGYKNFYKALNAKNYGIPQNRERIFVVSIKNTLANANVIPFDFPKPFELKLRLKDMLEDEVEEKYFLSEEQIESIKFSNYTQNQRRIQEKDICDCLCARDWKDPKCVRVIQPCIEIKEATKKGYQEAYEGDSVNLAYPKSETRRGRVGKQVSQTLQTSDNMGVVVKNANEIIKVGELDIKGRENVKRVYSLEGISPTLDTAQGGNRQPNVLLDDLRVRKLAPKEYWRLMGFEDEDFEKAAKINSNTQLYKQAGNSIVVNVLVEIFRELLFYRLPNVNDYELAA